jgi:hypothetical protein
VYGSRQSLDRGLDFISQIVWGLQPGERGVGIRAAARGMGYGDYSQM